MSTIAVNQITDASGGSTAQINGATPTVYNTMGRNLVINGDMRIDQRNAGASVSVANNTVTYTVDRWLIYSNNDGFCSMQQVSDAPAGFVKSLKFTTTTADASLASTQRAILQHRIEGLNASDLGWGTANAKTVTLSFWVRSSLTGTFGGAVQNSSVNRAYPFSYTISAADTWEQKTITISGDTTGTWSTDNSEFCRLVFGLGVGSTYSGTANSWAASDLNSVTGAVSVIGTLNATWYITGVQLEVGSVATEFERRPYGTELALCQRYFYMHTPKGSAYMHTNIFYYSNTEIDGAIQFPVAMRASPSLVTASGTNYYICERNGGSDYFDAWNSITYASTTACGVSCSTNISGTAGQAGWARNSDTVSAYLAFNSEL